MNLMYDTELRELLELVFHELKGAVVVDKENRVVLMTPRYCEILGIDPSQVVGRKVTDVIPHTRMHHVVESGEPEIGSIWEIKGETAIVNRIPIRKKGQIIGAVAFSVFDNLDEVKGFLKNLNKLDAELTYYRNEVEKLRGARYSLENIIGVSQAINIAKEQLTFIAKNDSTVLITGDTGTGKELFAHALHLSSRRRFNNFIKVNCAAIPDELMESELFGYESGAFTGARSAGKPGKFDLAHRGTIFLDEIGDLALRLQAKLLRILQDGEVEKVGSLAPHKVNVRIVAATNANLEKMVENKSFREDLYYRLNVISLHIPPLRDRREDIPLLAEHFVNELNERLGIKVEGIHPDVLELLVKYDWPGNVRELHNTIERTMNTMRNRFIQLEDIHWFLPKIITVMKRSHFKTANTLKQAELNLIKQALDTCQGNVTHAARLLGIHRSTIHNKLKKNKF